MSLGERILPFLSVTAVGSTICLFLCGLQICARIRERGNTDGTGAAPFLMGFISCVFWLQYGVLQADRTVVFNNVVGLTLYTGYLAYYYAKTRNRYYLNRIIFMELLCCAIALYGVNYMELEDEGRSLLGAACIILNIATIGAPLFAIGEVVRTKSSESLPLPLCLASFAVSVQWLLYGIIVDDWVIQAPNYLATFLSIVQLSLFVIYPRNASLTRPSTKSYSRLNNDYDKYHVNNNEFKLDI